MASPSSGDSPAAKIFHGPTQGWGEGLEVRSRGVWEGYGPTADRPPTGRRGVNVETEETGVTHVMTEVSC